MTFVQLPGIPDWKIAKPQPPQDFLQRVDGALQQGSVGDDRDDAGGAQRVAGPPRLLASGLGERHVGPAREPVLPVPDALPVAEEDERPFRAAHPEGTSEASLTAHGAGIPSSFAFSSNISLSIRACRS